MASVVFQCCKSIILNQFPRLNTSVPSRSLLKWTDVRMKRDVENRKILAQFAKERLRINSLRKNKILPKEIQDDADKVIHAMPRKSSISYLHKRCILTSRPRGLLVRWRMSRIAWRHLADHNNLSGVQRALW